MLELLGVGVDSVTGQGQFLEHGKSGTNVVDAIRVSYLVITDEQLLERFRLAFEAVDIRQLVALQAEDAQAGQLAEAGDLLNLVII